MSEPRDPLYPSATVSGGVGPLVAVVPGLRACFERVGYDVDSLHAALGPSGLAALDRGEPVPVRRALREHDGPLGALAELLLLGDTVPPARAAELLDPLPVELALRAGLVHRDGDGVRVAVDVRPVDIADRNIWVFSDPDGALYPHPIGADHVLGVGHASLSLLRATPNEPAGRVLDLGTGCGIQAICAAARADEVVATDISARCLEFAAASLAINGVAASLLRGPWYEPVDVLDRDAAAPGFDRIIANPPFVVGSGTVAHSYRDSGLALDGAGRLVVAGAARRLRPGGTATLLASWVHQAGEDWRSRVAGWVPAHGIEAWVLQRDVADPALYVSTWMRDGGLDPADPAAATMAEAWLAHLNDQRVAGIGFGVVTLRRTDAASEVVAEDLSHPFTDPLGPEVTEHLRRTSWLRAAGPADVDASAFALHPAAALERVSVPDVEEGGGWTERVVRVYRGDGPRWVHEIDGALATVLAGLRPDGLPLGDIAALFALTRGLPEAEVRAQVRDAVVELVRHGIVVPAALLDG